MFKGMTQRIVLGVTAVAALASNAAAAVVGFGIVITVALLMKAKSFLRG